MAQIIFIWWFNPNFIADFKFVNTLFILSQKQKGSHQKLIVLRIDTYTLKRLKHSYKFDYITWTIHPKPITDLSILLNKDNIDSRENVRNINFLLSSLAK